VAVERVDGLERPQRGVELRGMAVEGVERGLDALLLVALLRDRQILDARQRLARRRLGSGPGLVLHRRIMRQAPTWRRRRKAVRALLAWPSYPDCLVSCQRNPSRALC